MSRAKGFILWACFLSSPALAAGGGGYALNFPRFVHEAPQHTHIAEDIQPVAAEIWLDRMLDSTRNGMAFKNPEVFGEWLDAVTEPRFMTALAAVAIDPGTYPSAMSNAIDPATARNWAEFTDPLLLLRWAMASSNPSFQHAIISNMSGPSKLKRWMIAGSHPELFTPLLAAVSHVPERWTKANLNPTTYHPIAYMAQPGTAFAWLEALISNLGKATVPRHEDWLYLQAKALKQPIPTASNRTRY